MARFRFAVVVALVCACAGHSPRPEPAAAGRVGVHGMIVFGAARVFVSHLPMFQAPHDAQLIVEVRLASTAPLPDRFGDQLYTFEPEPFSLDALRAGELTAFRGTLYRGNFEQGGTPIARDVAVEIVRIILDEPLDPARAAPATADYLAIGSRDQLTLVHLISGAPGFDHLVAARVTDPSAPSDHELARGVRLSMAVDNTAEARIGAGRPVVATSGTSSSIAIEVAIEVGVELSCLVGPSFTEPCPPSSSAATRSRAARSGRGSFASP